MIRRIFGKKIGLPVLSVLGLIFAVYTVLLARRVEPLPPREFQSFGYRAPHPATGYQQILVESC